MTVVVWLTLKALIIFLIWISSVNFWMQFWAICCSDCVWHWRHCDSFRFWMYFSDHKKTLKSLASITIAIAVPFFSFQVQFISHFFHHQLSSHRRCPGNHHGFQKSLLKTRSVGPRLQKLGGFFCWAALQKDTLLVNRHILQQIFF